MITVPSWTGSRAVPRQAGWRRQAVVAAAAVVLAGACGGSSKDKPPPETTTPTIFPAPRPTLPERPISEGTGACALATRAEVEVAVGGGVNAGAGSQRDGGGGSFCRWVLRSAPDQSVAVSTAPGDPAAFEDAVKRAGRNVQVLTGVGDGAFVAGGIAYGLKGSTLVYVIVNTKQAPDKLTAAATQLIRAVVSRVP